ncbi:MAG TPA: hypothetical protein PKC96_05565 [Bacilli bacterium]|nr:hypothetical protein [Bacilli bacterium]
MNKEIRLSEIRFNQETEGMTLEGYPIVFNIETLIGTKSVDSLKSLNQQH